MCYDDRKLRNRPGEAPQRLIVVEFKRPGITISSKELSQVMLYKSVFSSALGGFTDDQIEVVIIGDTFDRAFDRKALASDYRIVSYEELLADARDRYRDLFDRLAPDGLPEDDEDG